MSPKVTLKEGDLLKVTFLAPNLSRFSSLRTMKVTVSPLVTQALKAQVQVPRDAQALKTQGYPGPHTALKFTSVHKNTYIYQYILYHLTYTSKSPINKWNNPKKSCISFLALVSPSVTRAPCFAERLGESHLCERSGDARRSLALWASLCATGDTSTCTSRRCGDWAHRRAHELVCEK